jgi:hypothetical protein
MGRAQAFAFSFGALKEEFLLKRYIARLQAENIKNQGHQILSNRMERMSDNMVLKTIKLSESTALEMAAIIDIPTPEGNRISTISAQQAVEPLGEHLKSLLGYAPSNPFKTAGELLEALEHIEHHFKGRQIKLGTEGG